MGTFNFKQGEDKKISVQILEDGIPLNVSACPNIKAIFKVGNEAQAKYAKITEAGHGKLEVDGVTTNQVNVFIDRAESKSFAKGNATLIVLCSFTNAEFTDSLQVKEFKFSIGRVEVGEGAEEVI